MTLAMNAPAATLTAHPFHMARPARVSPLATSRQMLGNIAKLIVVGAAVIAVAQAILSASIATDEYRLADLAHQSTDLNVARQIAQVELDQQSSLASLNAKARALGMVANTTPAFLRLADQRVLGVPTPATK